MGQNYKAVNVEKKVAICPLSHNSGFKLMGA